MAREYLHSLDNQAQAVDIVGEVKGVESYEGSLCQLLLGITERLEAMVEAMEGRYTPNPTILTARVASLERYVDTLQQAVVDLQERVLKQ